MIDALETLVANIRPEKTVLFLGAGASVPSGAPSARDLCRDLEDRLNAGTKISEDLAEVASILEKRHTRKAVLDVLQDRLRSLTPDGGLVALARQRWGGIYTTNYDRLIEAAFREANQPLHVVRSHYDWEEGHNPGVTTLYKLHGCVTEDRAYGSRSSMTLTYEDYDNHAKYRELLYQRLALSLAGGTAVVIGYSLADHDIQEQVRRAMQLQREGAAPGRLFLLIYQLDDDRADIWRRRGASLVSRGDINTFAQCIASAFSDESHEPPQTGAISLPAELEACTIKVAASHGRSRPQAVFAGAPASYSDIREGYTFPRDAEFDAFAREWPFLIVLGVAGTGKSTFCRRLLIRLEEERQLLCYEHRRELPLLPKAWLKFEGVLRLAGVKGVLFVDDCHGFQREVNELTGRLPEDSHLRVVVAAETSVWKIRQKEPRLLRLAHTVTFSSLSRTEVRGLLEVVSSRAEIRSLVSQNFLARPAPEQEHSLLSRCSADMFVCLKALFSADSLDNILLREFAGLQDPLHQAVYRTTCALEAAGAIVHRQMVLRLADVKAHEIPRTLDVLEGLVLEDMEHPTLGIFTWRTRHEVIARIISEYKYNDPDELYELLRRAIEGANPSVAEELRTLREMCNAERGIRAIPSMDRQIELYRLIARTVPTDRVSRHRLVGTLLRSGELGEAEVELRNAISEVRLDPPLQRYVVRLHIARSKDPELLLEDRKAILNIAFAEAEKGIAQFGTSKYMFFAAADAAEAWKELTGEQGRVEWAKHELKRAEERLFDAEIGERLTRLARI